MGLGTAEAEDETCGCTSKILNKHGVRRNVEHSLTGVAGVVCALISPKKPCHMIFFYDFSLIFGIYEHY